MPPFSPRRTALTAPWRQYRASLAQARLLRVESDRLFDLYPGTLYTDKQGGRMRANNLCATATGQEATARDVFRRAVRKVGGTAAEVEWVSAHCCQVLLPPLKTRQASGHPATYGKAELLTFGRVPGAPAPGVAHSYQLAQAQAQIREWSPKVRAELLRDPGAYADSSSHE